MNNNNNSYVVAKEYGGTTFELTSCLFTVTVNQNLAQKDRTCRRHQRSSTLESLQQEMREAWKEIKDKDIELPKGE